MSNNNLWANSEIRTNVLYKGGGTQTHLCPLTQFWREGGTRNTPPPPATTPFSYASANLSCLFLYARLQTGRIMVWWCPSGSPSVRPGLRPSVRLSVRPSGSPSARFPHFSPTCFDILSCNFAHDFVLMYYSSSSSVVTLRQFLKELCRFVNLEYRKCAVFRTFLLHALTYWAEILHMTLFYCLTDQVRVSHFCVNFWRSYASFWT